MYKNTKVTLLKFIKISYQSIIMAQLLFLIFPRFANASCEGISPTNLITAWYDSNLDVLIREEGDNKESHFVWSSPQQDVELFLIYHVSLPEEESLFLIMQNKNLNSFPEIVQRLHNHIKNLGFPKKINGDLVHYRYLLGLIRDLISQEVTLQHLNEQPTCPYSITGFNGSLQTLTVNQKLENGEIRQVGSFSARIPTDEESKTNLLETRCLGYNSQINLLAVHWVFECQGRGDAVIPVKRIKNIK